MSVSYETAEGLLADRLGDKALAHCRRVAETARLLAAIYGVDAEKARLAGLLHDWDRELSDAELTAAAERVGMAVDPLTAAVPYLLHAHTGAAEIAALLPELPEEVVQAVRFHTVGDPKMSDLDKVVYLADMLEPGRDYPGVDSLREAAGTIGLDELFANAYQSSVAHLVDRRKRIDPKTVEVWNALVARGQR